MVSSSPEARLSCRDFRWLACLAIIKATFGHSNYRWQRKLTMDTRLHRRAMTVKTHLKFGKQRRHQDQRSKSRLIQRNVYVSFCMVRGANEWTRFYILKSALQSFFPVHFESVGMNELSHFQVKFCWLKVLSECKDH